MVSRERFLNRIKNNKKTLALFTLSLIAVEFAFYFSGQDPITSTALMAGFGAVAGGSIASSASTVNPNGLIVAYNETIGDYSPPTSASASSTDSSNTDNAVTMRNNAETTQQALISGANTRFGVDCVNASSALVGNTYGGFAFGLESVGSPTGTVYCKHYNSSGSLLATATTTLDASTVVTGNVYGFAFSGGITSASGSRIVIEYTGGDASNRIDVQYTTDNNAYDSTNTSCRRYDGNWFTVSGDCRFGTLDASPDVVFDGEATTKHQTDSEIGSYIQADFSSALVSHFAIHPNANTDITELKIQTYDGSSWSDARTILWSAFTEGDWNFVRINVTLCQGVRFINNDGTAKIMSTNEIKYLTVTDENLGREHGHLEIDTSDSALGLDGL